MSGDSIERDSKEFLIDRLTTLREDLREQMEKGEVPHAELEKASRELEICERLLAGLTGAAELPGEEAAREYAIRLRRAADEANQYDRVALEHRALADLVTALAGRPARQRRR